MKKSKWIGLAVLMMALLLVLPACSGESDDPDAPHYSVGGEEFPALPTEEEPQTDIYGIGDAVTRTYVQFTEPEQVISDYVALMTSEYDFQVVTDTLIPSSAPDPYGSEGDIYLGRAGEPGHTILFELLWSPESVIVVTSVIPADIPEGGEGGMSLDDALTYMEGLNPTQLGLEGTSMGEYDIHVKDSYALINGIRYMQLELYSQNSKGSYIYEGSFLMSLSGQLYRLDQETNTMEPLEGLPAAQPSETPEEDTTGEEEAQAPEEDPSEEEKQDEPVEPENNSSDGESRMGVIE